MSILAFAMPLFLLCKARAINSSLMDVSTNIECVFLVFMLIKTLIDD